MAIAFTKNADNILQITRWIFISLFLFTILEIIFYPQIENLYGCLSFIIAWGLLYKGVLKIKGENRNKCLFPYLALFFLGISFFWLPLIATFIEGKPLTFRFQNPILTFNNQILNLTMMIVAYRLCLHLYHTSNPLQRLWCKLGYFTPPTVVQVWVMGIIGLISFALLLRLQGTDGAQSGNLGFWGHLMEVTQTFISFPLLLFFKQMYGDKKERVSLLPIILYSIVVVALGISTGKRTPIIAPIVTLAMCYLQPIFTQNKRFFSTRTTIMMLMGFFLITGPLSDLAMAMAVGRDNSQQTSADKTFENIWRIYQDKELIHNLYQAAIANTDNHGDNDNGWSEYYVDNVILDRFCNLRVCDATIYYARKLGFNNPRMHEYTKAQLLYLIPTPFLRIMGIDDNKFEGQYSPGDLMSTEGLQLKHQYHGYRVSGDAGVGLYLWGYPYYFYALFIYVAFFYLLSTKVLVDDTGQIRFSLLSMCELASIMWLLNNSSGIIRVFHILGRTGWQNIILYCIIFAIIRKIVK